MNKKIIIPLFVIVALVQLYIPAIMIYNREEVLRHGKEYKFRTAPVDPNDPFRGKYITLSFNNDLIKVKNGNEWSFNETVYAMLGNDENGYAKILTVSKIKPLHAAEYLKTRVGYVEDSTISIVLPFNRFYMEESKAPKAEVTFNNSMIDSTKVAYALVSIKEGEAVLKDVMIDGISIKELVDEE